MVPEELLKFKLDMELVKKYSYFLVGALILLLIYKLLDNFGVVTATIGGVITGTLEVLMPILVGVVLAYFLFRPMRGIEKFVFKTIPKSQSQGRMVRLISILVVYVITIILIVLFFYATIPSVIESLTGLIAQTPEYLTIIDNNLGESLAKGGAAKDILTELKVAIDSLQNMTAMDVLNQITSYFGTNPDSIKNLGNFAFVFLKGTIGFVISFFKTDNMSVDIAFTAFRIGIVSRIGCICCIACSTVRVVGECDIHFAIFWIHSDPFWTVHLGCFNRVTC